MEKQFFLCIGAQKAGTTWLHNYLLNHKDVFVPNIKELHFFDVILRSDLCKDLVSFHIDKLRSKAKRLNHGLQENLILDIIEHSTILKAIKLNSFEAYKDFFYSRVNSNHQLFGEITPSYSLLSEESFLKINSLFGSCKYIFIMRDPIARHKSAVQMLFEQNNWDIKSYNDYYHSSFEDSKIFKRGDYLSTITNLEKSVKKQNILYLFYEDLFSEYSIKKINSFLSISHSPAEFKKKINKSHFKTTLTEKNRLLSIRKYQEIYQFCLNKFNTCPWDLP